MRYRLVAALSLFSLLFSFGACRKNPAQSPAAGGQPQQLRQLRQLNVAIWSNYLTRETIQRLKLQHGEARSLA